MNVADQQYVVLHIYDGFGMVVPKIGGLGLITTTAMAK